jgi:hypothetical protein
MSSRRPAAGRCAPCGPPSLSQERRSSVRVAPRSTLGVFLFAAVYPYFGLVLTVIVCAGAFWRGGREAQLAAGGFLLGWAATIALRDRSWIGTQWSAFAADAGLLLVLLAISLRTTRWWPLFAAAFELLCVLTHVARIVDPGVHAWGYATAQVIFTQFVIVAIGVGVLNNWLDGRTDGQPV